MGRGSGAGAIQGAAHEKQGGESRGWGGGRSEGGGGVEGRGWGGGAYSALRMRYHLEADGGGRRWRRCMPGGRGSLPICV